MRQILLPATRILISAALLLLALRKVDLFDLASRVNNMASLGWLGFAIGVSFLQIFVGVLRWREVSAECKAPLAIREAMRINVIGAFFNQMLPSSIGGDAVRLWMVARGGAGWRAATYSIFVDRAVGLIVLAVMIVALLPWSYHLIVDARGRSALVLIDSVALVGGFGFVVLGTLRGAWLERWWGIHHLHACAIITSRVMFSRYRRLKVASLSLMVHVLTVVIAWCAIQSITAPASFAQALLIVPPVMLISIVPVSIAGWGVREAAMGLAFVHIGLTMSEGVELSLLIGAVSFIVGAIGGLVWMLSTEKGARKSMPINASRHTRL